MGMIHAHQGNHPAAAEALRQAADLQPMNGAAWYALGMAWHHCHEPDRLKAVIEHCAEVDPQAARRLIQETERADLAHLVAHLQELKQ
jgi:predicted TPR repeat methyltransferase